MTPASRTAMLTMSVRAAGAAWACPAASTVLAFALASCHWMRRFPRYSTRNERKIPAMRMADAVASNASSPRHSLVNMRLACV
jgi:hypothetical protein